MEIGVVVPCHGDVSEIFDRICEMGFQSCQVYCEPMNDAHARLIEDKIREYRLRITAMILPMAGYHSYDYPEVYATLGLAPASLRADRIAAFAEGAAFAHSLGIKDVLTHIGHVSDNPLDPSRREIQYLIGHLADELKARNQNLLMETGEILPVTWVQMWKEIGRDNIFVNFDPSNLITSGRANPCDALDLLMPWVRGFHVKDGTYPSGMAPEGVETRIGEGQVDFKWLFRKLRSSNYTGDLTIERELQDGNWCNEMREARELIEDMWVEKDRPHL